MCLFRPFSGEASKVDAYLIRRTDGQAFGATGAAWTVGLLQQTSNGGMRVRYRAAAQYMECRQRVGHARQRRQNRSPFLSRR